MQRTDVLLARPHPTIVESMTAFLVAAGYQPKSMGTLDELGAWPEDSAAAIVISTSVASTVHGSFEDVVRAARRDHPHTPLVFATVVDATHAQKVLSDMLDAFHIETSIHTVGELSGVSAGLRPDRDVLLLNRQDIADDGARARAAVALNSLLRSRA